MTTMSQTAARLVATNATIDPDQLFDTEIRRIAERHMPSRAPFFARFAALPRELATDPDLLGQLHLVYQAAMHATRVAVYHLPHLDSPALRKRKVEIFVDDDGLPGGDTHHYQLTRAFRAIGARCVLDDEAFGEIEDLCRHLDPETAHFSRLAQTLYARSLGAWCIVEMLSVEWMRSLAAAIGSHFPSFPREQYFTECFDNQVEERHAEEALEITRMVARAKPGTLAAALRDARLMAEALDGVWRRLDAVVSAAEAKSVTR
jgi:pyrroloquinoline quinone (PQQ) biosynthesis protein C